MNKLVSKFRPFLGLVVVVILFTLLSPAQFHTFFNFKTIITQSVIIALGALGMTLVIVSGGIDLSVGSQIALYTVVVATLLKSWGGTASTVGVGTSLAAAGIGVVCCILSGAFVGGLVSTLRLAPFIASLGVMQIARGLAKWIAHETTVVSPPGFLQGLMMVDPEPHWLIFAPGVWLVLVLLILLAWILKQTVFGRYTFAIGSNEKAALLCGVPVKTYRVLIYGAAGIFTGFAGIMQYANLTVGDPTAAFGMELDIITAVVIGGGSLNGGKGSVLGSVIGALVMAVLRNGCNMLGVATFFQEMLIGGIIIAAVALEQFKPSKS